MSRYFEHELMRGIHASQGLIGTAAGPRTPGTAYVYLHHAFGMATGRLGRWGFVRGGQGAITQAQFDGVIGVLALLKAPAGAVLAQGDGSQAKPPNPSVGTTGRCGRCPWCCAIWPCTWPGRCRQGSSLMPRWCGCSLSSNRRMPAWPTLHRRCASTC